MDDIDIAQEREDFALQAKIAEISSRARNFLLDPQNCLNGCGEPPRLGSAFCSGDCAGDFQKRLTIRRNQGLL